MASDRFVGKISRFSATLACGTLARGAVASLLAIGALIAPARAQRLHVYDLKATPKKIGVKWDASPTSFPPPSLDPSNSNSPSEVGVGVSWSTLHRSPGGTGLPLLFGSATTFNDGDWQPNTQYEYWLTGTEYYYTRTYNTQFGYWHWVQGTRGWRSPSIYIEVKSLAAAAVATADSRVDPRFSTLKFLDYNFNDLPAATGGGTTLYRGGLFAGFQQDAAKVGRTYLKFSGIVPSAGSGNKLWPMGGLFVYVPRLAKPGSMSLTTRVIPSNAVNPSSLVWTTAPSLGASMARSGNISWSAGGSGQWVNINVTPDIEYAAQNSNTLSLAVLSANEASAGWAYMARSGYSDPLFALPPNSLAPPSGLAPYLLYGLLGPGANLSSLSLVPSSVVGASGTPVTATVTISSMAPENGFEISLASNNSAVTVPASVTIPEGQTSATFPVEYSDVTAATTATVTAVLGNSLTTTLSITPSGSGGGGGGNGSGQIDTLSLSSGGVPAGTGVTGTITLSSPAPTGGTVVSLSSNNTGAAQVPASVTVAAGTTVKTFAITTGPGVAYYQPATISATAGNTKTASLFVYPSGGGSGPPAGGGGGPAGGGGL